VDNGQVWVGRLTIVEKHSQHIPYLVKMDLRRSSRNSPAKGTTLKPASSARHKKRRSSLAKPKTLRQRKPGKTQEGADPPSGATPAIKKHKKADPPAPSVDTDGQRQLVTLTPPGSDDDNAGGLKKQPRKKRGQILDSAPDDSDDGDNPKDDNSPHDSDDGHNPKDQAASDSEYDSADQDDSLLKLARLGASARETDRGQEDPHWPQSEVLDHDLGNALRLKELRTPTAVQRQVNKNGETRLWMVRARDWIKNAKPDAGQGCALYLPLVPTHAAPLDLISRCTHLQELAVSRGGQKEYAIDMATTFHMHRRKARAQYNRSLCVALFSKESAFCLAYNVMDGSEGPMTLSPHTIHLDTPANLMELICSDKLYTDPQVHNPFLLCQNPQSGSQSILVVPKSTIQSGSQSGSQANFPFGLRLQIFEYSRRFTNCGSVPTHQDKYTGPKSNNQPDDLMSSSVSTTTHMGDWNAVSGYASKASAMGLPQPTWRLKPSPSAGSGN
jgi:hypothetical protein